MFESKDGKLPCFTVCCQFEAIRQKRLEHGCDPSHIGIRRPCIDVESVGIEPLRSAHDLLVLKLKCRADDMPKRNSCGDEPTPGLQHHRDSKVIGRVELDRRYLKRRSRLLRGYGGAQGGDSDDEQRDSTHVVLRCAYVTGLLRRREHLHIMSPVVQPEGIVTLSIGGFATLIQVFDMPTSLAFYRDVPGFEVISDAPEDGRCDDRPCRC